MPTAQKSLTDEQYQTLFASMKIRLEKIVQKIEAKDTPLPIKVELARVVLNHYLKPEKQLAIRDWFIKIIKLTEDENEEKRTPRNVE